MKNRVLCLLLVLLMPVLCLGCGKDEKADQPVTSTENVVEDTQQQEGETSIEENIGRTQVEDEEIVASITALIDAEKMFRVELDGTWSDYEGPFEINELPYRLVDEEVATSWADYEERAKAFYTEEYIKQEFTPRYTAKTFVEKDGRLYRAEADGIILGIIEDTIEVFESVEGRYYVTFFVDAAGEEVERAFLIEPSKTSPYGYVIVEKIEYVK